MKYRSLIDLYHCIQLSYLKIVWYTIIDVFHLGTGKMFWVPQFPVITITSFTVMCEYWLCGVLLFLCKIIFAHRTAY